MHTIHGRNAHHEVIMSNLNTEAYLRAKGVIDSEPIDHDHPCPTCGYNLRGLKYGHKCPECGIVIERRRYQFEHFMDAPLAYMKIIRLGMILIAVGLFLSAGSTIITPVTSPDSVGFMFTIFMLGCCLFTGGFWIITRPRPDAPVGQTHCWSPRKILRILSISGSICLALIWVINMQYRQLPLVVNFVIYGSGYTITFIVCAMSSWLFSDFARWIHDDKLGRIFELLIMFFAILWLIALMSILLSVSSMFGLALLVTLATFVWYFISIMALLDLINRAVRDKPIHDASILRDPEKILR